MTPQTNDAKILIGVCGGIAAYKVAGLVSTLVQRGAVVDVIMSRNAERFVAPLTFAALTARPVYASLWDAPERIPHIRLVREASVMLIAPATADTIARLAHGAADDLVTTAALAARIPVIVAPAMNEAMYEHPATIENVRLLRERGYEIVEPERGFLAERETGLGRLAAEERLVESLERSLARSRALAGTKILVTAGPTREAFDPIRFLSNASTGSTGIAIAREAALRGGDVTLLLGPTLLEAPPGVTTHRFTSAAELYDLALEHARGTGIVVATAAVADWRPAEHAESKLKKTDRELVVRMVPNPDVLAAVAQRCDAFLVGFAAETDDHEANAREKLERKGLDAIVVNDVRSERGFGPGENTLVLLWRDGRKELGTATKTELAARLLDAIEALR
jgi:phosphopantothenoylcysteine decarboxylase / phosphopantothenate---cysteine ligase